MPGNGIRYVHAAMVLEGSGPVNYPAAELRGIKNQKLTVLGVDT